ncbi:hypothetical protein EVAR_30870_1 [Eumeta japonica]|uniref:Uncharacterized protein n=1 Tax=Eumeta variegata TaxID=151549 RepID=A0A4C1V4R7_EUMVA|nr:hypothetical protein EVAR_30870_1 [Eumeta japonica]
MPVFDYLLLTAVKTSGQHLVKYHSTSTLLKPRKGNYKKYKVHVVVRGRRTSDRPPNADATDRNFILITTYLCSHKAASETKGTEFDHGGIDVIAPCLVKLLILKMSVPDVCPVASAVVNCPRPSPCQRGGWEICEDTPSLQARKLGRVRHPFMRSSGRKSRSFRRRGTCGRGGHYRANGPRACLSAGACARGDRRASRARTATAATYGDERRPITATALPFASLIPLLIRRTGID